MNIITKALAETVEAYQEFTKDTDADLERKAGLFAGVVKNLRDEGKLSMGDAERLMQYFRVHAKSLNTGKEKKIIAIGIGPVECMVAGGLIMALALYIFNLIF